MPARTKRSTGRDNLMRMPTTAAGQPVPARRGWRAWATAQPRRLAALLPWLKAVPRRLAGFARRSPALAREHWLLTALLAAGLVLRVLAQMNSAGATSSPPSSPCPPAAALALTALFTHRRPADP